MKVGLFFFQTVQFKDVPWKKILQCKTIWAVNIGGACWAFCSIIQGRMMPLFLDDALKVDIVQVFISFVSLIKTRFVVVVVTHRSSYQVGRLKDT